MVPLGLKRGSEAGTAEFFNSLNRLLPCFTSTTAGAHSLRTTHGPLLVMKGRYSDAGDSTASTKRDGAKGCLFFHPDGPVPWEPAFRIGVAVEQHDRGVEPVHGHGRRRKGER